LGNDPRPAVPLEALTVGTGELDERRPVAERERALAYGAEFRLGSLQRVSRGRQMHRYIGLGIVFCGFVLAAGLPTLIGIDAGPYTGVTKAVVSAVVGALFAGCAWLLAEGRSRTRLTSRLYRYSDGLAQLVGDEAEPRVARWADVGDTSAARAARPRRSAWAACRTGSSCPPCCTTRPGSTA
jgi:hypothetical protein